VRDLETLLENRVQSLRSENSVLWNAVEHLELFAIRPAGSSIPQHQCAFCGAAMLWNDYSKLKSYRDFPHMETCILHGVAILRNLKGGAK
jgi:hypothetical protein